MVLLQPKRRLSWSDIAFFFSSSRWISSGSAARCPSGRAAGEAEFIYFKELHLQELVFKVCDGPEALAGWHRAFHLGLWSAGCDQGEGDLRFRLTLFLTSYCRMCTQQPRFIFQQELAVWKEIRFTTDFSKNVKVRREKKRKRLRGKRQIFEQGRQEEEGERGRME